MQARIDNPALTVPGALKALRELGNAAKQADLPETPRELGRLRASQINGCSACIEGAIKHAHKSGADLDDRLLAVAAWGHSPLFSAEERAALALTEAMTRLADRADPVPDEIWNAAAEHFDDRALAALVLHIALTNLFNRLNVTTR